MIRKIIYNAGVYFRNNYIFKNFVFLKKSESWTIEQLQSYQFKKLKELIKYAYENSVYYKKKFDESNVIIDDIHSLSDIEKLPITTKDDLLYNINGIQISDYPEKLFYSETSGSSGNPLIFYRNKDWDAWHRASVYRGYSWYGVQPWEKNGYFWGYNIAFKKQLKVKVLDLLQNRFRIFSYKDQELYKFIKKLRNAVYLEGYSSMIYEVAKKINKNRFNKLYRFNKLKLINGTSEKIFIKYQEEVKKAFGKKIVSEYGAAESGIIAFECANGNMHVNMETVIVEEVQGEILVTNLVSYSFPIIRYKLGDYIALEKNIVCRCGMQHDVIKNVLGRVGKVIYGKKEQYPSLTLYYVFKNLAMEQNIILNYQAVQRKKGSLILKIENDLPNKQEELLLKEFSKYFKDDINLTLIDKSNFKSTGKKQVDFISEL